jgi:hypothetical protein
MATKFRLPTHGPSDIEHADVKSAQSSESKMFDKIFRCFVCDYGARVGLKSDINFLRAALRLESIVTQQASHDDTKP